MAEFCQECSIKLFGKDFGDFKGLVDSGEMSHELCEGCGYIWVDENGKRIDNLDITEDE